MCNNLQPNKYYFCHSCNKVAEFIECMDERETAENYGDRIAYQTIEYVGCSVCGSDNASEIADMIDEIETHFSDHDPKNEFDNADAEYLKTLKSIRENQDDLDSDVVDRFSKVMQLFESNELEILKAQIF